MTTVNILKLVSTNMFPVHAKYDCLIISRTESQDKIHLRPTLLHNNKPRMLLIGKNKSQLNAA